MGGHGGVIHYELIILYGLGFKPKDAIKHWGYSRSCAYRFYRIYRIAEERARNAITHRNSVSPTREAKAKHLDHLRKKKGRPPAEKKPVLIRREDGEYDRVML
jgi:hypothetical protein